MSPTVRRRTGLALTAALMVATPALVGANTVAAVGTQEQRVDLATPVFTNPTRITNPLFPISSQRRVVQLGISGLPARAEVTVLPTTKTVVLNGKPVTAQVSQYVAYDEDRLIEVAYDLFAQADDGAVWYLGEDVSNYKDGKVINHDGTWLAGRDGPPGMIMPGDPKVGDVYYPENIPGLVFEQVTVQRIGQRVHGPRGPVPGAIAIQEKLQNGDLEQKVFAPGYGELLAVTGPEVEAVAVAVPVDAVPGPLPAELVGVNRAAARAFDAATAGQWPKAVKETDRATAAWDAYSRRGVPRALHAAMSEALAGLATTVDAQSTALARSSALDVAQAGLDLQLRHRPTVQVDLALLGLRAQQVLVDVDAKDRALVLGDYAVLETLLTRIEPFVDPAKGQRLSNQIKAIRAAGLNPAAANAAVRALLRTVST